MNNELLLSEKIFGKKLSVKLGHYKVIVINNDKSFVPMNRAQTIYVGRGEPTKKSPGMEVK